MAKLVGHCKFRYNYQHTEYFVATMQIVVISILRLLESVGDYRQGVICRLI
jgi:hypothetical protein